MKTNGLSNLRDLGGIIIPGGRITRHGLIFRSESPDRLSAQEFKALADRLGLHTVIDLRTPLEIEERPYSVCPGVEYIHIPVFRESVMGITKETGSDTGAYIKRTWNRAAVSAAVPDMRAIYGRVFGDDEIVDRIGEAVRVVVGNAINGRTTMFHCSQGKDRTGAIGALLLSLLGADRETVFKDYELGGRIYRLKAWKDAVLMTLFKWTPVAAVRAYHANLAEREFIQASYGCMDALYGSAERMLRDRMGINDALRDRFILAATTEMPL